MSGSQVSRDRPASTAKRQCRRLLRISLLYRSALLSPTIFLRSTSTPPRSRGMVTLTQCKGDPLLLKARCSVARCVRMRLRRIRLLGACGVASPIGGPSQTRCYPAGRPSAPKATSLRVLSVLRAAAGGDSVGKIVEPAKPIRRGEREKMCGSYRLFNLMSQLLGNGLPHSFYHDETYYRTVLIMSRPLMFSLIEQRSTMYEDIL